MCSTLTWGGSSAQTVEKGKHVQNNFQDITSTRKRSLNNPLSLEAAAGFLWPREKRIYHVHIGEEAIIVLSGELLYRDILGNKVVVREGDILRYRSELFHELSSVSKTPVEAIVMWWVPSFRGSELGAIGPETWARANTPVTLEIDESTSKQILKGARKFCLGLPAMIGLNMDALRISRESLANMIGRTHRYVNELLNGFLIPSPDVLCNTSKKLGIPADHLIWRHQDHEAWVQLLTSKGYRQGDTFSKGVISVKHLKIGVSASQFHHRITESTSDKIFIVLKGGLNLQRADLYNKESKDIAATAEPNEAIHLRADHDCVLFPLHKDVEVLEISVSSHAEELENWLRREQP